MKNFARIIDLGEVECCAIREGLNVIRFHFHLRTSTELMEPTFAKVWPNAAVVDHAFNSLEGDEAIKQQAQECYKLVKHQLDLHADSLEDGIEVRFDQSTIRQMFPEGHDA